MVLRIALYEHGCPTGIVSDGGGIVKATQVRKIYKELGIERHRIEPGAPWQNYMCDTKSLSREWSRRKAALRQVSTACSHLPMRRR